ncbi:arylesterase [Herminiimonas glaciei]|uniref:Arylesterase n=1 Tax=Herminiimonas glaciei TaxID=523788 RepID=A0ABW2I9I7_9BURK
MNAYSASKTIVVLGDSLSAEYGLARGEGWVSLLQKKLEAEKINATIINASISGETTSGGATRLQALLDKHQPAVVVIELGANDALRGLSLIATQQNLRSMVAASKKAKARVLLVGMQIPPNYGTDYTRQFAELFPKIAKETKSALVPFMLKDVADKANLFQADRIHPSAEAHPVILNNIWPQLKPLLTK